MENGSTCKTLLIEYEKTVKFKTELVTKLEEKTNMLTETIEKLDKELSEAEKTALKSNEAAEIARNQVAEKDLQIKLLTVDLKSETEQRNDAEEQLKMAKDRYSKLNTEMAELNPLLEELEKTKSEKAELQKKQAELENTLEDMGEIMKQYDLRLDSMKEVVNSTLKPEAAWADDKKATNCEICSAEFSITKRKHHCRYCGGIFCNSCSDNVMSLPSSSKPVRVCDNCYTMNLNRFSSK